MSDTKLTMIRLSRHAGSLIPHGDVAWDVFEKLPTNKPIIVSVHMARNPEHLQKFWALAGRVANFSDSFLDADDAVRFAKRKLGMVKYYYEKDGAVYRELESISVESMDQVHFNDFYDRCLKEWAEEIGCDPEMLSVGT